LKDSIYLQAKVQEVYIILRCQNENVPTEWQTKWPQELISDVWLKNVNFTDKQIDIETDRKLNKLTVEGLKCLIVQRTKYFACLGNICHRHYGVLMSAEEFIHLLKVNKKTLVQCIYFNWSC